MIVTAAVYAVGIGHFFYFDSIPALPLNNSLNNSLRSAQSIISGVFSFQNSSLSRPLTMLTFTLEAALQGGVDARRIQITNIGLHLFNGVLAFCAVRRLITQLCGGVVNELAAGRIALLATLLWLLSPLHVSTVLYAVQRMTLLAATFSLLGLNVYAYYRGGVSQPGGAINLLASIIFCTLLATLCKENGILLLPLIAVIEWISAERKRGFGVEHCLYIGSCFLLFALFVLVFITPFVFPGFFSNWYAPREYTIVERLLTEARICWDYVLWFLVPLPRWLSLYHDDIPLSTGFFAPWTTAIAAVAWCAMTILAVYLRRRLPLLSFGILFFVVGHLMESTIIPLELVFEDRNYLPSLGLALIGALSIELVLSKKKAVGKALCGFVLLGYMALLFLRTSFWSSEMLMARTHYQFHPQSPRSLFHWANVNLVAGEKSTDRQQRAEFFSRADRLYTGLVELDPQSLVAPVSLFYMNEKYKDAKASQHWLEYLNKLSAKRVFSMSDYNAVNWLSGCAIQGWCSRSHDAVGEFLTALERQHPDSADFNSALAKFQVGQKNWAAARHAADKAVALNPSVSNRFFLAAIGSSTGDQSIVYEQVTLIQRNDWLGLQSGAIKELFRSGKLAL